MTPLAAKTGVASLIFYDQKEWRKIDQELVPFLKVTYVLVAAELLIFFSLTFFQELRLCFIQDKWK